MTDAVLVSRHKLNSNQTKVLPLHSYGFTLLEILVVLVIIAIMSSVIVLKTTSTTYSHFMSQMNKVATTLTIMSDEAVYTDSVIACNANPDGFSCDRYKDGQWSDLDLNMLVAWGWPDDLTIKKVYLNGVPLKEGTKIRFYANGDVSPMSFELSDGTYNAWIDSTPLGNFTISN